MAGVNSRMMPSPSPEPCPLLRHIPKLGKSSGNEFLDNKAKLERDDFCKIVELAWANPSVRSITVRSLREAIAQEKEAAQVADGTKLKQANNVDSIDPEFQIRFILTHTKITPAGIKKAREYDPEAPKVIFARLIGASGGAILPGQAIETALLWELCVLRWIEIGKPWENVTDADFISADGKVKWMTLGPYDITLDDQKKFILGVRHRRTNVAKTLKQKVPLEDLIFNNAWNDMTAIFKSGESKTLIADAFKKGEGPKAADDAKMISGRSNRFFSLLPEAQRVLDGKKATLQAAANAAKASSSSGITAKTISEIVSPPKEKTQTPAIVAALEARRKERGEKRNVSITG